METIDKQSAVDFINQMFPTEASLSGVEPLMQKIHSEVRRVDAEILASVRQQAVNQLCSHFEAYRDFPKITELREKFKSIKQILKSHVFSDFSSQGRVGQELLQQGAYFVSSNFEGAELAKLDKTERRYAWIKRRLRTNEEIWKIFPSSWHVPYLLCIQFCKLTRTQLVDILNNLKEKPDVGTLLLEETWEIEEGSQTNVLSSSMQVFLIIRRSLKRCSALTKNQTLFNLFKVFQRILKAYATKLFARLPKGGTGIVAAATGMDGQIKTSDKDERLICYIVNTAEYCHKTSGELAENVSKIVDPQFADRIDMSEVQDEFSAVITKALITLVHGIETKFDAEMAAMTRVPWGTLESVGDQSEYVNGINTILTASIPVLGRLLSPIYFQFFLDKVILSPVDSVADTYCALLPEGTPGEFQRILDLKGVKRTDQQSILDDYNKRGAGTYQPSMKPVVPAAPNTTSAPVTATQSTPAGIIPLKEELVARAAALGRGAATTGIRRILALTESTTKDRKDGPLRKLFIG
ncbi:UNVERIFIED_CONTAM: Vacuolar protein sorting-associated protein 53 A [Sesamum latifolium]|uniref:Vacuolar protein sorting-associated protein 53 A n=1 Tax=Sesamum latifolium TaxID=2727402 RepID=A0AAW2TC45_9LAMI